MSESTDTNEEEKKSLLEQLEEHLETTSARLWEDRAKAMEKQLKAWGVDMSDATRNAPYVIVGGYQFQMLDDDHVEVGKENGRGVRIGRHLHEIIDIIKDLEKPTGRPEK